MKIRHHIYAAAVIGMLATTAYAEDIIPVSYTHLTLPTIYSV